MVKKLNPVLVQEKLLGRQLTLFTPREFYALLEVTPGAGRKFIHHYVTKGLFIKLRNGLYALKGREPSPYVIANKLYRPSYISLETALSYHQLIPETVYSHTSVTTKATQEFTALNQTFTYTRIKKEIFQGYNLITEGSDKFLMAEPEKAVADYLYTVALGHRELNDRLYWQRFSLTKLKRWIKLYNNPRLTTLFNNLDHAYHHTN